MKPVSNNLFTEWEEKARAGQRGVQSISRGHKVNILTLCHATSSTKNGEILYPARECVKPHFAAVYSVAVRSFSIVERVLQVNGFSDPPNLRFHGDYGDNEDDHKFDGEAKIARKPNMAKSVCGELVLFIKPSEWEIAEETDIVSEVRLVQGVDTLLLESSRLSL